MDAYDLQARHAPIALVVLPALLVWAFFAPFTSSVIQNTFGAAAIASIYALLAAVARGRGLEVQNRLVRKWGGLPSTTMLRHRDQRLNVVTKLRYHQALTALGFQISTPEEEGQAPEIADARLEGAMDEVRRQAKERKARLVAHENIAFGFMRNLLGLRPIAIAVSLASAAAFATFSWIRSGSAPNLGLAEYGLIAVLLFHALGIVFLVTPKLVTQHAEAYARALFEEILVSETATLSPRGAPPVVSRA